MRQAFDQETARRGGGKLPVTTCYSVTVDQRVNWTSQWFLMCLDWVCWKKHIDSIQHSIWREEFRNWTWPTIRTFLSVRSWRGSSNSVCVWDVLKLHLTSCHINPTGSYLVIYHGSVLCPAVPSSSPPLPSLSPPPGDVANRSDMPYISHRIPLLVSVFAPHANVISKTRDSVRIQAGETPSLAIWIIWRCQGQAGSVERVMIAIFWFCK